MKKKKPLAKKPQSVSRKLDLALARLLAIAHAQAELLKLVTPSVPGSDAAIIAKLTRDLKRSAAHVRDALTASPAPASLSEPSTEPQGP